MIFFTKLSGHVDEDFSFIDRRKVRPALSELENLKYEP